MILHKWSPLILAVLFTALSALAADEPSPRPSGPPPGFRPPGAGTEAQCESCDKAAAGFSKLKLAAQDIEDKTKSESNELEEEMRRILEKRKERVLKKIDSASCPQQGRENSDLDLQKLVRSFEMDSSDGKMPDFSRDRNSDRDRDKNKDTDRKKPTETGIEKKQAILQMRMKDEIEEAVEDKKETCARRARLKEYENDSNSNRQVNTGNMGAAANMGGGMNTNQALMMMAAISRMSSMGSSMGMGSAMGGMNMGMNYGSSMYGGSYPNMMNMQQYQMPYSMNQTSPYMNLSSYGSSYPNMYGNGSSYGVTYPNAGSSIFGMGYPYR